MRNVRYDVSNMKKSRSAERSHSSNLYAFIRAVLGESISDNEVARRWGMDARMFNDLKHGRIGVPRIEKLRSLAKVLGINPHFVYAAGAGVPVPQLMNAVKREDVSSAVSILAGNTIRAEGRLKQTQAMVDHQRRKIEVMSSELQLRNAQFEALVDQLLVAVMTLDVDGRVLHLNPIAREVFGVDTARPGVPLLAATKTMFLDMDGRPFPTMMLPSYRALSERKPHRAVFSVHRDGKKGRLVAATATPMFANRRFIGVISVLRDVEDILSAIGGIGVDLPLHPRLPRLKRSRVQRAR
jgi:PAS domain S-box-containing protein